MIVEVKDLSYSYGPRRVLHHASFGVEEGEFVGIIGPNGGGKTTLLKLLLGFLEPEKGDVRLFGKRPKESRGRVGYVPQRLPFDPQFPISTLEVVLSGRLGRSWRYSREDLDAAHTALERVGLEGAGGPFRTLSGGQAQRALIARALTSDPDLLLLDEPLSGVDVEAVAAIYALLSELSITRLMVTHNLESAIERVDRILAVQTAVSAMSKEQVCQHYAIGLYHKPLLP